MEYETYVLNVGLLSMPPTYTQLQLSPQLKGREKRRQQQQQESCTDWWAHSHTSYSFLRARGGGKELTLHCTGRSCTWTPRVHEYLSTHVPEYLSTWTPQVPEYLAASNTWVLSVCVQEYVQYPLLGQRWWEIAPEVLLPPSLLVVCEFQWAEKPWHLIKAFCSSTMHASWEEGVQCRWSRVGGGGGERRHSGWEAVRQTKLSLMQQLPPS